MTGRVLSFASLLMASSVAFANEPIPEVAPTPEPQAQAVAAPFAAKWKTTVKGTELLVELTVVNTSDKSVDVVVARGSSPGPYLIGLVGNETIGVVQTKASKKETMTRMGPMPVYSPMAANSEVTLAAYTMKLPDNYKGQPIHLEATIEGTIDGQWVQQQVMTDVTSPTS